MLSAVEDLVLVCVGGGGFRVESFCLFVSVTEKYSTRKQT